MKVLIGVDGSDNAFEAVRQAGQLLSPERDEVGFYYTATELRLRESGDAGAEMRKRAQQALADAVFDEARRHLPGPLQAKVHTILGTQKARHGLVAAANDWHADLIVVGARGTGPLQNLLLGSVSSAVVDAANVPVLVARTPKHPAPAPQVLVGYDNTNSGRMAEVLQHFTWPAGSQGWVISVIEALLPGSLPTWLEQRARDADIEAMSQAWVHEHEQERQAKLAELKQYLARLPEAFRTAAPIVAEGHPGEKILQIVEQVHATLVVVGKTDLGAIRRWVLGSTSEQVLHQAPCSVLVVPLEKA